MNDLANQLKEANSRKKKPAPKNMGPGPSTKKIRAILRLMTEFGITKYSDAQVDLEMAHVMIPPAQQSMGSPDGEIPLEEKTFSFDKYDEDKEGLSDKPSEPVVRDDLGYSDEDYLWRSAET